VTDDVGIEALRLLSIPQVAELLGGVNERTVWRQIDAARKRPGTGLESVRVGTRVLVPPDALAEYIRRLRAKETAA
jgi:hypothetical protein